MGYKADHSDHDTAFARLLQTAHENNVKLNFKRLQYKQTQVDFFGETYTTVNLWMLQFLISYFMALTLNIYIQVDLEVSASDPAARWGGA